MIGWLRRQTRDYLAITAYLVERDRAVAQRTQAYMLALAAHATRVRDAQDAAHAVLEAERMTAGCRSIVTALIEPGLTEQCTKVRLRDHAEAEVFAARVLADTGVPAEPYKCRRCPRQPVSLQAFWHITHADPAKRSLRGKDKPPATAAPALMRHVTPADVARMRSRTDGRLT